jgi:hypothetical protein
VGLPFWVNLAAGDPSGIGGLPWVAFGDYLGASVPFFSSKHMIASIALGPWT